MLLEETEVKERIESPLNLLNRLRSVTKTSIPSLPPPSAKDIIDNLEEKIAYGSIKSKAAGILGSALDELKHRLPEVQKPKELAAIADTMSKVVSAQQAANSNGDLRIGQVVIYAPQIIPEDRYDVIDVSKRE